MKQSKKEYNVDKLIQDLDPNGTGFIAYHTIAHFMKPTTTHRVLPGYENMKNVRITMKVSVYLLFPPFYFMIVDT